MLLPVVFSSALLNLFVLPLAKATLTSCVTCSSCQDHYDGSDSNVSCSATVANADSCQKTRIQLPGTTYVLKTCAKSCQQQSIIAGPIRFDVTCCSTDNCNGAIATHPQIMFIFSIFFILSLLQHYFIHH